VSGNIGASSIGQPVAIASDRNPENELIAAEAADTAIPAVTHQS
jgi:hypothetical protein